MNFFALSALVNLLSSLLIGSFVLFRNTKNSLNRNFAYFCFSVAFWSFGYIFWQLSNNYDSAYFWSRFLMVGAAGAPLFYFTLVIHFLKLTQKRFYKWQKFFAYGVFSIFTLLNITTQWLVKSVEPRLTFPFWPIGGRIFYPFLLAFFGYVIYASILLGKEYKRASGIKKIQTKYIFLGIVLAFFGGATNYFLWFNIPIPPVLNILVTGYPFAIGYAIIRYRLMDIRVVISRSFLYFILVAFVTGSFVFTGFVSSQFFDKRTGIYSILINAIFSLVIVLVLPLLHRSISEVTNRIFFKKEVNYQQLLRDLTQVINVEISLEKLVNSFCEIVREKLKLKKATIFLATKDQHFLSSIDNNDKLESQRKEYRRITNQNPLIKYLSREKEMVITEELERKMLDTKDEQELQRVYQQLSDLKAALTVPIITHHKITAILILWKKLSGEAFSQRDIDLFQVLSPQIGSAIEKAKLYQELQEFNKRLKKEVERATLKLNEANKYLQELDKAKSEFMSIASHQLRTPLTGIMGYLSMLVEGDFGKLEKKQGPVIHQVFEAAQRLIRLVNIFLNISRIENNRFTLNLESKPIESLINDAVFQLKIPANNKGLKLEYVRPKQHLQQVQVDTDKMKDVFLNLIDNAIKYTAKGSIVITTEFTSDKKGIHVKIQDTGIGIDKEETKKLFQKFVRGDGIARIQPDGSGLGLFIAKKIVEAHGGKIWVESEGLGMGSTFQFILPATKRRKE